ncbi:hypothetical protein J6590_008806 [Homalodisca vitripennis]|nr:hypothetical protein J6590_008806 [Homalodisca vitripennis]
MNREDNVVLRENKAVALNKRRISRVGNKSIELPGIRYRGMFISSVWDRIKAVYPAQVFFESVSVTQRVEQPCFGRLWRKLSSCTPDLSVQSDQRYFTVSICFETGLSPQYGNDGQLGLHKPISWYSTIRHPTTQPITAGVGLCSFSGLLHQSGAFFLKDFCPRMKHCLRSGIICKLDRSAPQKC